MNRQDRSKQTMSPVSEAGFALPSTLFLITILTLVASSVLAVLGFYHRQVVSDLTETRARWAAESAIAISISGVMDEEDLEELFEKAQSVRFPDETEATVHAFSWGAYLALRAEGKSGQSRHTEVAIIADQPGELFENALLFANSSHQLVFSGDSRVIGNVRTAERGATTGSLRGRPKPAVLPIVGALDRESGFQLREPRLETIRRMHQEMALAESIPLGSNLADAPGTAIRLDLDGPQQFAQTITRNNPLYIRVAGPFTIEPEAVLTGLVAIAAEGEITVRKGAIIDGPVLHSERSITVEPEAEIRAQLISPSIELGRDARLRYPSLALLSEHPEGLMMNEGSRLEGMAIIAKEREDVEGTYIISPGAAIAGALYSLTELTFDGELSGTLATTDFSFYEAPTRYRGWLRTGAIDRSLLPRGFLIPPGVEREYRLTVLDWL